jgi:hypothetical protein
LKIYLKSHIDGKNDFAVEDIQVIAEGELVNRNAIGTICVLVTIIYLRRLGFKVGKLNQYSYSQNQDRHPWNEMLLLVHETTLTNNCEVARCSKNFGAAGFSKDSVSELLHLLVRTCNLWIYFRFIIGCWGYTLDREDSVS